MAVLPRRDDEALARLDEAAGRARPVVDAGERAFPVADELGELLPGGGLQRGSVVSVEGAPGTGATAVALHLAAAATAAGEWAAAVELHGSLGGLAARDAGIVLERFAVVPRVPPARWASVVAALLDGVGLVLAEVPPHARAGDARRLAARARERGTVLVAVGTTEGVWPAEATVRLYAEGSAWRGLAAGVGFLADRTLHVRVEGRAVRPRVEPVLVAAG